MEACSRYSQSSDWRRHSAARTTAPEGTWVRQHDNSSSSSDANRGALFVVAVGGPIRRLVWVGVECDCSGVPASEVLGSDWASHINSGTQSVKQKPIRPGRR